MMVLTVLQFLNSVGQASDQVLSAVRRRHGAEESLPSLSQFREREALDLADLSQDARVLRFHVGSPFRDVLHA